MGAFIFFFKFILLAIGISIINFPCYESRSLTLKRDIKDENRRFLDITFNSNETTIDRSNININLDIRCSICKIFAKIIQDYGKGKITRDEVATICVDTCIALKMYSDRVCRLAVQEFKEWVLTVADMAYLSPDFVCGKLVGESCAKPYDPNAMWNITIPGDKPPVSPPQPPKPGSPMLRVLHLSDIHVDPLYAPGADAECGEPLCCRNNDEIPAPTTERMAGYWGDVRQCDTPFWTLDNMFQYIADNEKFDYIILTGDLPPHNVWNQTRSNQLILLKNITNMLQVYFPNKSVFAAVGNHESVPVNSFPQPFITGEQNIKWLYTSLADSWTHWIPDINRKTIEYGAYYSTLVQPGFRIISLNMNYCDSANWWLLVNATDPAEQLSWLVSQLRAAEFAKEKVHILGHQPPSSCMKAWSWNYYKIVTRFENNIAGQFFGHTHNDEFKLFYDDETLTRPVSVLYAGGSVTPSGGRFPGYRIYDIDGIYPGSSWMVQDHSTFILNLTLANMAHIQGETDVALIWQHEYSAKKYYGMKSLFPRDWDALLNRFATDDVLFQGYNRFFSKSSSTVTYCDVGCKKNVICNIRSAKSDDPRLCPNMDEDAYEQYWRTQKSKISC